MQALMPRVLILQGQVQSRCNCKAIPVFQCAHHHVLMQARSVLGVSFFGCSHLQQGSGAGESL